MIKIICKQLIIISLILSPLAFSGSNNLSFITKKIEYFTSSITNDSNELDLILEKANFPPTSRKYVYYSIWDYPSWSSIRKLETAYMMAEANKAGSGEKLLKDLAFEIAKHNIAIVDEPGLKNYFPEGKDTLDKVERNIRIYKFKTPNKNEIKRLRDQIPKEITSAIETISKYAPSLAGGTTNAMAKCCNIAEEKAFEIIRNSSSIQEILEVAIKTGIKPPSMLERLKALFEFTKRYNKSIELEIVSIDSFIENKAKLAKKSSDKKTTELKKYKNAREKTLSAFSQKSMIIRQVNIDLLKESNLLFLEGSNPQNVKDSIEYRKFTYTTRSIILESFYESNGPFANHLDLLSSLKENSPKLYSLLFVSYQSYQNYLSSSDSKFKNLRELRAKQDRIIGINTKNPFELPKTTYPAKYRPKPKVRR